MTRFSRVTFNAAHNYLGLTSEVLRTEKAINDIACHPLPPSFYDSGLKYLRQRFDKVALSSDSGTDGEYFSHPSSAQSSSSSLHPKGKGHSQQGSPSAPFKNLPSRQQVHAGDLHISTGPPGELHRQLPRRMSTLFGGNFTRRDSTSAKNSDLPNGRILPTEEFDLRDEVMSCIAKSIGLIQPPMSRADSVEASPAFPPSDSGRSKNGPFRSSFGSLSMLDVGDDASSVTGSASSSTMADGYMSGLDNEVEILFFSAGSVLAKAGERNTGKFQGSATDLKPTYHLLGLFYVIEGFLDIILPGRDDTLSDEKPTKPEQPQTEASSRSPQTEAQHSIPTPREGPPRQHSTGHDRKPLFTVKAGGIAGYLCKYKLPFSVYYPLTPNQHHSGRLLLTLT